MAPTEWPATILIRIVRSIGARRPARATAGTSKPSDREGVTRTAVLRRTVFIVLALAQTAAFAYFMATHVLPYHGQHPLEVAILSLFTILFAWVSLGFWTALSGFVLLCVGGDRHALSRSASPTTPIPPEARTAIVMPIRNEHVARVFAGIRATWESVAATGLRERFDFFVLSDSSEPDTLVAERQAWVDLCTSVNGFGTVFYRWRRHRVKRKSGNIADFCRRWGSQYRYMVVLDADSVMSGECLTTLVRLMEANPTAGIVQTAPCAAGRETPLCAHAAVRRPGSMVRCSPPVSTSGSWVSRTTGATMRSSASPRSFGTVRSGASPDAGRCRARSCRTTSSRRR